MNPSTTAHRPLAIGDLQGCNARLGALLHRADPDNSRPLWFAGDLVNRGPHSLAALRRLRALGERATVVLGNHDLHLLASATGVRKTHRSDTLDDIMLADDRTALLDWVRTRPLAHLADGHLMVHAGVFAQWTPEETVALAAEVQAVLSGPHWVDFLRVMYGNTPTRWSHSLSGDDRLRTIVNGLTRMRFIDAEGGMDFAVKEGADDARLAASRETAAVVQELAEDADVGEDRPLLRALAEAGAGDVASGALAALGSRMDEAQALLASCELSSPELDAIVAAAKGAGALGAKLTGAGGGGSAIALCDDAAPVVVAIEALGFGARVVELAS